MANHGISFSFKTGDIRRIPEAIGRRISLVTHSIFDAIKIAVTETEQDLREEAQTRVEPRTGALVASVDSTFSQTVNTLHARVGFLKARGRVAAAASTLTGNSKMPIRAQNAEKLAFPIYGVSDPSVFTSGGTGKHTVQEMKRYFKLSFTKNAILGEPLGTRSSSRSRLSGGREGAGHGGRVRFRIKGRGERNRVLLFVRKKSVRVRRYINLSAMMKRLEKRIKQAIRTGVKNAPVR